MHLKHGNRYYDSKGKLQNSSLPGFEGVSINHVVRFVIKGFRKGVLVTRASAIAFNLLMVLIPATVFLFTLIPFIPIQNFHEELIKLFESILPVNAFSFLETTIVDVITRKSTGFLFFMFVATIVFSTNGIHAIINAFVVSSHSFKPRSWVNQRKISVILLLIGILMIGLAGFMVIFGKTAITRLVGLGIIERHLVIFMLILLKWIIVILLMLLAISFLYYFAPAIKSDFRFISPGSIVATILFIITSLGFSAYVNNFGQYNKLYGWIGTLIVILVWLYLNSIALLIGFELNLSIKEAKDEDDDWNSNISCNEETL
ncbi:MAG TPA: YihY/virulence factor BrkB family protein [Bacteroidales bacterium]|nr:YihY/virulence factor BrkB family protein [Bacteroidales bacterium]